jgi:tetratricopeptide (TPR) repeat protein
MKNFALIFTLLLFICNTTFSQSNENARTLVKEGMKLSEEKNYDEAVEKYRAALKIDSGYLFAGYQAAVSLLAMGKGDEGIPYLEKIISSTSSLNAAANDVLGLIYFHDKKYAEAEKYAIEAIKLDPKHAGTMRMYGLVCFHQNKRAAALLGLCSFILLEPNTPRSAGAYGNIQHIVQGGALKPELGEPAAPTPAAAIVALNQAITNAVNKAAKERYASPADLLAAQLKSIFTAVVQLAEKQTRDDFFRKYQAAYFYQLAQSANMPAFARLISGSNPESAKWITEHSQLMNDLYSWVKTTERSTL